jgi:hypothetical protein
MRLHLLVTITSPLLLVACSDDHGHADPDVEGCEHVTGGPFTPLTATADATGAPAIAADHMAYTVTLLAAATGNSGHVSFAADEAALFIFYVDQPVTAAFTTSAGAPIAPQASSTSVAACAEIQGRHVVSLEIGTAFVQLSSPTASSVNVVVEHALEDHDH